MTETARFVVVFLFVAGFIFLNQEFFKLNTDIVVIVSILIAMIVYSGLVLINYNKSRKK